MKSTPIKFFSGLFNIKKERERETERKEGRKKKERLYHPLAKVLGIFDKDLETAIDK